MATEAIHGAPAATAESTRTAARIGVSVEAVIYVALGALALVSRLAGLDTIPLNHTEAREALAAWHFVWPDAPGTAPLASSPLLFALNSLAMTLFGGGEMAARFMTALGGTALALLPALWRREMGRVAALMTAILLIISPTALTSARTMSPAVWAVVLAGIGLWLAWRFVQTQARAYAVGATTLAVGVTLLAEPAGFVLLLILAVAWGAAALLSADDAPEVHPAPRLRTALAAWPWRNALTTSGAMVLLVATLFFLYPRGLSHVGELLGRGLAGIATRPAGHPLSFPLLATLLYEPVLWVLGGVGVYFALNESRFLGRFLFGWLLGGLLASLLYAGAGPAHALWLVVPLAALAGDVAARILRPVQDAYWDVPGWAVPALGIGVVTMLFISLINLLWVARPLMNAVDLATATVDPLRLLIVGMGLLLLVILFLLGGSLWGARAAWKGLGLGLLLFLGAYGLSSAWRVAVERVDDPRELWHVNPVGRDLLLLRETVQEVSERVTGEPDRLEFVTDVSADGAVAWQLRDFADLEYVSLLARGTAAPLIVTSGSGEPSSLGARYVGQNVIVSRTWDLANLRVLDLPVWILFREAQVPAQIGEQVVLWVRDDVYGLPPEPQTDEESSATGEESAP